MQRTVSAACLFAIVRNGTAKPVSLETRFSGENRDRKKKTAQLSTSTIGNLLVDPYCAIYVRDDRAYCTDDTNTPSGYFHKV